MTHILNNVLNRGHKQTTLPDSITNSNIDLANEFNDYFISIGEELSSKISHPQGTSHQHFLTGNYQTSFFLKPTDKNEIINIIKSMKTSNSAGEDEINSRILKSIANVIADPVMSLRPTRGI